jgi:hypothetical protein
MFIAIALSVIGLVVWVLAGWTTGVVMLHLRERSYVDQFLEYEKTTFLMVCMCFGPFMIVPAIFVLPPVVRFIKRVFCGIDVLSEKGKFAIGKFIDRFFYKEK